MAITSKRVAKIASKLLRSKKSSSKVKTVSASDLRQREKRRYFQGTTSILWVR